MKSFLASALLFSALVFQNTTVQAQGVYVTPGENGPVFSDKPRPGAKEITLPPLNVVPPPRVPRTDTPADAASKKSESPKTDAAAFEYRGFSVVFPENEGSVVANTAVFEVRVAVDPPLQLGEGHAIMVSINGRSVGRRFTASEFMIPPEFWGDSLPPANQSMQLDASIVDGNGHVLKMAAPVRFFMRHATITNRPGRPGRPPIDHPKTPPVKPKPEPESPVGSTMKRIVK
jgi:hypothetical protein